MISVRLYRASSLTLAALNIALLGLLIAIAWNGTPTAAVLATPAGPRESSFSLPASLPAQSALGGVLERPVFYATRHYVPPVDPNLRPAAPPLPPYKLTGTFLIPRRPAQAFLRNGEAGASRTVHPGDDLDGWQVQTVERNRVVLSFGDQTTEITARGASDRAVSTPALGGASLSSVKDSGPTKDRGLRLLGAAGVSPVRAKSPGPAGRPEVRQRVF